MIARTGSFEAQLSADLPLDGEGWLRVAFDLPVSEEGSGGSYDPETGVFVAHRDLEISFTVGIAFVSEVAVAAFRFESRVVRNGAPARPLVLGAGSHRTGSLATRDPVYFSGGDRSTRPMAAGAGDEFAVEVRTTAERGLSVARKLQFAPADPPVRSRFAGVYDEA